MSIKKELFDYIFKYIIIGDMGVGKSCLLAQFTEHKFLADSQHTIGVEFGTKVIDIDGTKAKLQIWDTAGQERFKAVCRSYYRGASGALLVFDVTRRSTFQHILTWLNDAKVLTCPDTVMLMIGNKTDLEDSREVSFEEASNFANENNLTYIETSSKTGENVEQCFYDVGKKILESINTGKDIPVETNTNKGNASISNPTKTETTNSGCC